ncbi:hydrogenase subunit MbhD domain-containing protein [Ancylobacter mangrovi]|uniref:hydrogenase subunit MbhD domain-containing protein n=1 Tax=Ancylobacter mangrovi TaxID=2972472 RepID=UPI002163A8D6|nr:hydrogenase subunit MbhD domain-containing protein [Ancylobacter mangrovi]MCS0503205.1 DUF4040 domain-containing protein [Ancylobacter mangrovi]
MNATLDAVLTLMLPVMALFSLNARDERSAVIGFMALGLLLALVWVRLGAVDVALTEAAIGALTGVLLLGAASTAVAAAAPRLCSPLLRGLLAIAPTLVAAGVAVIVAGAPDPAPSLAAAAAAHLGALELGNPVTAVLLAYRALDTLLETVVVLLALIGVWSLAGEGEWRGAPAAPGGTASRPLVLLARLLPPVGLVVAVHLLWAGAEAPGGKFQAATLIAAMWLLVLMAGLRAPPKLGGARLRGLIAAGPAVFIAIGLAGFLVPGQFLAYPEGWAKAAIIVIEVALTASLAAMLALIVLGPGTGERRT